MRSEENHRAVCAEVVFLFVAVVGASIPGARAQSYVFGRADFATGNSPVAIVTGDFNGDGKPDLAVADQSANTVSILLGEPSGAFAAKTDYAVGTSPSALAAGDFNGDGKLDLAVTNAGDGTVSILLGNGNGTLQAQVTYGTGKSPHSVAIGDFNGDGKLDLAVANNGDNTVSVLLGNGDGTFAPQVTYATGNAPTSVVVGDFRNDGNFDLVVAGAGASILQGNGDGTFGQPISIFSSPGPESAAVGDINGDGYLDLVIADSTLNTASLVLNNGTGIPKGSTSYGTYSTGASPVEVIIADFNGDGMLDFATADEGGNDITVELQNGTPTFLNFQIPGVMYAVGPSPSSLVTADFNGDGRLDFAVPNLSSNYVSVILGRGDGTFELRNDYTVGFDTRALNIANGDFTDHGELDLVLATPYYGALDTLLGNGDGTFQAPLYDASFGGYAATPGDFNGDGKLDLAVTENTSQFELAILLGNGDGTFDMAGGAAGSFGTPAVGDFNGDGKLDVAAATAGANTVSVILGNGDGTLQAPVTYATATGPNAIAVADLNGDGILDLAVTDLNCSAAPCNPGLVSILLGNGDGTFKTHVDYPVGTYPSAITIGDFNKDGKIDLAVANMTDGTISVLLGNGDGTFQTQVTYPAPNASQLAAADFNSDGNLDLGVVDQSGCSAFSPLPAGVVSVLFGNGDGTFQPHTDHATLPCPVALTSGDFNGDGAPDLAVLAGTVEANTTISVLLDGPYIALFPTSLTFSSASVGTTSAPQTVTITNPGAGKLNVTSITASGDFSQTNNCPSSLASQANCTVTVTLTATSPGTASGSLTISDNSSSSPQTIVLTGMAGPAVTLSPTSLTFGSQLVGTLSAVQVVTLTNTGVGSLDLTSGFALGGADSGDFVVCASMDVPTAPCRYAGIMDCGVTMSLDPGESCTVGLAFDPTAAGTRMATLSFTNNAPGSPQVVTLTGTGTAPAPVVTLSPTSLSFSARQVGMASSAQTVTLTNTGNAALTITSVTASGDFFVSSACGSSVAAGAHCTLTVIFKPTAAGTRTGAVTLTDNAPGSPQTVSLTGTATAPAVSLKPDSLSFATSIAGQSSVATPVTLTNKGSAPLAISGISLSGTNAGDFSQQNNCGTSVAAGATCTINVTFKPTAGGTRTATLMVTDNALGSPQNVALSGTGQDFSLATVGSSSATVTAGQSATYQVQVSSQGNFSGSVSLACSGAPAESTCTIVSPAITGGPITSIITVTTTARSSTLPRNRRLTPRAKWPVGVGLLFLIILAAQAGLRKLAGQVPPRPSVWAMSPVQTLLVATLLTGMVMLALSCGGSSSTSTNSTPSGTPAGTYTVTVTGTYTSGSVTLTNSTALSLTVQ